MKTQILYLPGEKGKDDPYSHTPGENGEDEVWKPKFPLS
jgi:hypothetical protein